MNTPNDALLTNLKWLYYEGRLSRDALEDLRDIMAAITLDRAGTHADPRWLRLGLWLEETLQR